MADTERLTIVNLCSSGVKLLSWKIVNVGAKDEKATRIVTRLQEVAVERQLPGAVVQVIEMSRPKPFWVQDLQKLTVKLTASVLHEDGRTWIWLDGDQVLPEEFRDKQVIEAMP